MRNFEAGSWYKWIGPKERPVTWNANGRMDAMLTGKPFKCTCSELRTWSASFEGIPGRWNWRVPGAEGIAECFQLCADSNEPSLRDLEQRISVLENRLCNVESRDEYDKKQVFVGIYKDEKYLLVGAGLHSAGYFRWYTIDFEQGRWIPLPWYAKLGESAIREFKRMGGAIYGFRDAKKALEFFTRNDKEDRY